MKRTGLIRARLAALLLAAVAGMSVRLMAAPQLPEPELTWKNVTVDGRKTAVFSLLRDSRGIMWIGTNSGLYFYDGVAVRPVGHGALAGAQIYSIAEHCGRLYLGANHGLVVYDCVSGAVSYSDAPVPKEIRCLLVSDGRLWIGSLYGMYGMDLGDGHVSDLSAGLPHRSVYSVLRDSRGIVYAGTFDGLARWDFSAGRFSALRPDGDGSPRKNLFVNCLLESADGKSIYVGTEGSLYEYRPVSDSWSKVRPLESNTVKSLARGAGSEILVGTDNGVFVRSGDSLHHYRHDSRQELSLSDNEIWCIYADPDHNIWAGHERGFSIASNSSTVRTVRLSALAHTGEGNEIHVISRDSGGNLWLGGTNGIIRLAEGGDLSWYRHSDAPGSLSHNRVRAIDEDAARRIWLSTDGGLNRYDPLTGAFDVFHIVDGRGGHNSNWVYAFEEDSGSYWVGGFLSGVHRIGKARLSGAGGTVAAEFSLNADSGAAPRPRLANDLVNNMATDRAGNLWILLFRDSVLSRYSPASGSLDRFDIHKLTGAYPTHMCADGKGRIWCAFRGGAAVFDSDGSHRTVMFPYTGSDESVLAVGKVGDGIWISTLSNVWSVRDGATLLAALLPIPQKSYTAVYEDTVTGNVLLGGTDEILEVDYRNLSNIADYKSIRLIMHGDGDGHLDIYEAGGGRGGIDVPYGGSVTLVVSTLDYSPDTPQRFMYKLAASPADTTDGWVVMPEGTNTIALSGLKMGARTLLVKTVGSAGGALAVPLRVAPPRALSWWAIAIYVLAALAVIAAVVWYMRRRALRSLREQERQTALENVERKLTFLSTISHDLKTPLSMILGPVSIMKEKAADPDGRRSLETVYDNAVRLNNMIHRTIELQHLEDGGEDMLILSTFDVVDFCRSVFEVFRDNHARKKFVFHSSCPRLLIEADAVKFESVMTNLLSNACKYSGDGATVSCGISAGGGRVEITVSDDGCGIADIDQPLVFQRMFRAPATSGLREGTGLGLYLIKRYLELMKGSIELYSKEGQGTTFVVTLPAAEGGTAPAPAPDSAAPAAAPAGPKILIVEDNLQISAFIAGLLRADYTVFTAENGRSGLAIAASVVPDLIIADEMMPIMSGLDMVRRIKQNPRLASVPVVMLTARSDSATEAGSIRLGIDAFMAKPFEPAALVGRIGHLLRGRSEIREKVRIQAIAEAEVRPIEAESVSEKQLARIARAIEDSISDPDLNVNLLCERCGIPNKQLYRLIKKYLGIAPLDYIRRVRLQKAAVLLGQQRFTVAEISYMVGFKTPSYFAKCFQAQYGVRPSQYRSDDDTVGHK